MCTAELFHRFALQKSADTGVRLHLKFFNTMMPRIIILLLTIHISNLFPSYQKEYVEGMVIVSLKRDLFKFPLEVYGAFISISDDSITLSIDRLCLLQGTSLYYTGSVISYKDYFNIDLELASSIRMDFKKDFIKLLKKIDAYYIERGVHNFNPLDTLPHVVNIHGRTKVVRSPNFNLHLTIMYKSDIDARMVVEKFKKLESVTYSVVNQKFIEDIIDKPSIIYKEEPVLPDSMKVNASMNIVVVAVLIDTLGQAEDVALFSSRDKRLNPFALDAAKKCRFLPAKRNGKKIKMKMNVKFTFH